MDNSLDRSPPDISPENCVGKRYSKTDKREEQQPSPLPATHLINSPTLQALLLPFNHYYYKYISISSVCLYLVIQEPCLPLGKLQACEDYNYGPSLVQFNALYVLDNTCLSK